MNAKTSCFNKKIYTKTLTQGIPFILLMTAFLLLFSLGSINSQLSNYEFEQFSHAVKEKNIQYTLYTYSCEGFFKAMLSCYSFLCGIFVFRYLYNRKLCGTIHSLPLTRTCMFLSNTLSGLTMMIAPFLITAIVIGIYMLVLGYSISHIPLWIVVMIGYCLIFYALSVLTAMLTGHLVSAPVIYCFLNFGFLITQALFQMFVNLFYFGLSGAMNSNYYILTPFVYLLYHLHAPNDIAAFAKDGLDGILIYAIVSVVILAISWFLYGMRKLETQGDPIVSKKIQPVLLYLATAMCAAVMSVLLFAVFFNNLDSYYADTKTIAVVIVLFLLCSILIYFILNMLLKKTVHVFKGKHKGLIVYLGAALLTFLIIRLDVLNIENKIPDIKEIASVKITYEWNSHVYEDKESIATITDMHKELLDNKELLIETANTSDYDYQYARSVTLTYNLKNKKTITRDYYMVIPASGDSKVSAIIDKWQNIIHSPATMLQDLETARTYLREISITPNEIQEETVIEEDGTETTIQTVEDGFVLSTKDNDILLEALEKDIKTGTLKLDNYYHTREEAEEHISYYVYVDSWSDTKTSPNSYTDYSRNYAVTENCTNTLAVIEELAKE